MKLKKLSMKNTLFWLVMFALTPVSASTIHELCCRGNYNKRGTLAPIAGRGVDGISFSLPKKARNSHNCGKAKKWSDGERIMFHAAKPVTKGIVVGPCWGKAQKQKPKAKYTFNCITKSNESVEYDVYVRTTKFGNETGFWSAGATWTINDDELEFSRDKGRTEFLYFDSNCKIFGHDLDPKPPRPPTN